MDLRQRTLKFSHVEQQELVSRLLELPAHDFLEVLRAVFETRVPDVESRVEQKFFLGVASIKPKLTPDRLQLAFQESGIWLQAVPYVNWNADVANDYVVPEGFYEFGRCSTCQIDLISSQRKAICPVCGSNVPLT